jgi:hypothetical protein
MRLRTVDDVQGFLDGDLIWRKKELTQFKFLLDASQARADRRDLLLRAGVTLLYAHWEGYVKATAVAYLEFLSFQRLRYDELAYNFLALASRKLVRRAGVTESIGPHIELTRFFREGLAVQSNLPVRDGISTKSNLSSRVLSEILATLGLNQDLYATKANLIDETLLESRNTIAHGEYLLVTPERWNELHREVLGMMQGIANVISNAVSMKRYLAA